jgi:hydrogenase maturation protein HypF
MRRWRPKKGPTVSPLKRFKVRITGLVQGVGFRPFLYRLAAERELAGWAKNAGGEVLAEIEGPPEACRAFLRDIRDLAPAPSRLRDVEVVEVGPNRTGSDFAILPSDRGERLSRFIPVDIGICSSCRSELRDAGDRRHDYPFINCCHCGPRYSIIRDLPYDRERTSMSPFHFCIDCRFEYEHEADRRYHAEPNACWECGPHYTFLDSVGRVAGRRALEDAIHSIKSGGIVAVKGIGGFHLVCAADDENAISRLRNRKRRPDKPLAVMVADLAEAARLGEVGLEEAALLSGPERPVVLLRSRDAAKVAFNALSPGLDTIGVMLPYAPVHVLLFERLEKPLVYTSANRGGEALITDNEDALDRLRNIADAWLWHDREIVNSVDDSVVRSTASRQITIRAGRGKAPHFLRLPGRYRPILAAGADLKSSICLAAGGWAHVGPFVGDMEDAGCFERYRETVESMRRLLQIEPEVAVCDRHSDYVSTGYARSLGLPLVKVQHHHAHIAAVMAEHGLTGPVIGVAFDGAGWGDNDRIWGGEWLVCNRAEYQRAAHLKDIRIPGGDAAARQPWRSAFGHLQSIGLNVDFISGRLPGADPRTVALAAKQLDAGVNASWTSSCGRLFEAVAALALGETEQSYEGHAASLLEAAADAGPAAPYAFALNEAAAAEDGASEDRSIIVDPAPMWSALLDDLTAGAPAGRISAGFHDGLAQAVRRVCEALRARHDITDVVLAGGVFVNAKLLQAAISELEAVGFTVYTPDNIPINDGGISLGQAAVAAARETAA